MKLDKREINTVPNYITAARLAVSPYAAYLVYKNPRKYWKFGFGVAFTDKVDGFLARLSDRKNPDGSTTNEGWDRLAEAGFRRSKVGEALDPFTDVVFGGLMVSVGMAKRIVPKWLGGAVMTQKTLVSAQTISYKLEGLEQHVTKFGQISEFVTNGGLGMLFAAESVDDPADKQLLRGAGMVIAMAGLAGKSYAAFYQYRNAANEQRVLSQAQPITEVHPEYAAQ